MLTVVGKMTDVGKGNEVAWIGVVGSVLSRVYLIDFIIVFTRSTWHFSLGKVVEIHFIAHKTFLSITYSKFLNSFIKKLTFVSEQPFIYPPYSSSRV